VQQQEVITDMNEVARTKTRSCTGQNQPSTIVTIAQRS